MKVSLSSETKKVAKETGLEEWFIKFYAKEWMKEFEKEKLAFTLNNHLFTIMFLSRSDVEITHVPQTAI